MAATKARTTILLCIIILGVFIMYRVGDSVVNLSKNIIINSKRSIMNSNVPWKPPQLDTQRIIKMLNPTHPKKTVPSVRKNRSNLPKSTSRKSSDNLYAVIKNLTSNKNNDSNIKSTLRKTSQRLHNFVTMKKKLQIFTTKPPPKITKSEFNNPLENEYLKNNKLHAGRLKIIDLQKPSEDPAHCLASKTDPSYIVCIYDTEIDNTLSLHLKNAGTWEASYIPTFQKILRTDRDLGFIDIGANIGPWGLLAATMGHKTVMVEPYPDHVSKIKKAVQVGKITQNVVLIENALSDVYEAYTTQLAWGDTNLGAIRMVPYNGNGVKITSVLMDDILEVITFKRALLKIDAEGFEDKALSRSDKLFKHLFIPYVLMEWAFPKYVFKHDARRVMTLINNMLDKGYLPYNYGWKLLEIPKWPDWPLDLIWAHKLVTPIC